MKISIGYDEIHSLVENRFGKKVEMCYVDPNTVRVTYYQKVLFVSLPIHINVSVVEVRAASVRLKYNGGAAVEKIASGVLDLLKEKISAKFDAITVSSDLTVDIDLMKIEKTKAAMEMLSLKELKFDESGINIILGMR
ncbi:MAG: hypothetical protein K2M53_09245 [Muribaculaceae bacterium]|nr:hypothetical protein [Muribaculaceae bacterium]